MPSHASIWFRSATLFALACLQTGQVAAENIATNRRAIWHCSRNSAEPQNTAASKIEGEFVLSSMDTIGVTLTDLVNVYSGKDVRIGNMPLIGCFMPGQDELSKDILKSLDLKPYVLQKLSVKSSIVQSQLVTVTDEEQMQICLDAHFPSFGYFSREVITEKFAPCF